MATITAATNALSDVQTAINSSSNGDTIQVPSGTVTWGSSGAQLVINKSVTVTGLGTTLNFPNDGPTNTSGVFWIQTDNVTVKNFTINGNASGNGVPPFEIGAVTGFRVTGITYNQTALCYFAYIDQGLGVIDHNTINSGGNSELIFVRGASSAWQTASTLGTSNAVYIETNTFTGDGYVCDFNSNAKGVVRYNTITGQMKVDGHGFTSNSPARSVRHMEVYGNNWTYGSVTTSPAIELRGGTGVVFDNSTLRPAGQQWFFLCDYGPVNGDQFPNDGSSIASITTGNPTTVVTATPHGYTSTWPVYVNYYNGNTGIIDGTYVATVVNSTTFTIPVNTSSSTGSGFTARFLTPFDYPLPDQIGVGQDPKAAHSEPMYVWNNSAQDTGNGPDWSLSEKDPGAGAITLYRAQIANPSATFTMLGDIVKADRDYFKHTVGGSYNGTTGMGRGTKATMNGITPSLSGTAFWVTDEGSWDTTKSANTSGRLYKWSGSAWTLFYTPYTYPNPATISATLTGGSAPVFRGGLAGIK